MEEQKYAEVLNYLWENEYPDDIDKCKKKGIFPKSAKYEVMDVLLVLKGTSRSWIAND